MNQMKDYNRFYDALTFTDDQKAQIAAQAAKQASGVRRRQYRSFASVSKIAAVAACLCCVLTVTAEAAGIRTPLSDLLAPIFGDTVAQTEVIDNIGRPVDASDTDNGITVSAEAIIGDQYNACLIFSFKREDGQAILPEGVAPSALQLGGFGDVQLIRMGGTHGSARFLDLVPGDNEIHYLHFISSDQPLNKGMAKVSFENLYAYPEQGEDSRKVLDGKWKFSFEVDYEDSAVRLGNGETFEQGDIQFTITDISVSPIAVKVSYTANREVNWSNAPSGRLPEEDRREVERYLENVQLLLTKKDGAVIDLSTYAGGSIRPENGSTYCTKATVLDEIIPLEELESVTVGGIVFPVDWVK